MIASQAVITGAYSLVYQAIQLGLLPRLAILHTSASHVRTDLHPARQRRAAGRRLAAGRDVPHLERARLRLRHRGHDHDGGRRPPGFHRGLEALEMQFWQAALLFIPLIIVDFIFFSANLLKLLEGAWAPLLFGASLVLLILTWRRGTNILTHKNRRTEVPLDTQTRLRLLP